MPQLNPAPWFPIMCATWMILTISLLPKMTSLYCLTTPSQPEALKTESPWTWPWY